jgi:predicted dehydrogenase
MVSRRVFVGAASAASALRVSGANDRIRLGIIGTGGRGTYLMRVANKAGGVSWAGVCDAWDRRREQAASVAAGAAQYADYRRLLERADLDAVIVATWDHLHAQITADACRAGKDAFVEKPMTSLPMQGPELVRTVRETRRVVQVGTQQRSMAHFIVARKRFFETGLIGRVNMVRTVWNGNSGYLTPVPPDMERKPEGLDWDSCLGWLPKIPWNSKRYFNRFAYWDFATGGQTGGLFVHWVDVVHWYLNLRAPTAAVALGGIYRYDDGRDTPDNINGVVEYPERLTVTFEATLTDRIGRESADIVFMGSGGRLSIRRSGYRFLPSAENAAAEEVTSAGSPEDAHMANWLDCIRSREEPNAGVVAGHYSAMSCHMLNLAYREKRRVHWQPEWDV